MTQTTMHAISAPIFVRYRKSAIHILDKAAADAAARKIDEKTLLRDRLYPDMLPCWLQFFIAGDHAKGAIGRLSGVDAPKFADHEPESFAAIKSRLEQVIAFVESVAPDAVNGSEDREVSVSIPGQTIHFEGLPYLTGYAMPNFMFHLTTAYGILRKNGVPLGKGDFLGGR
jgi:uncharacterized protein